MDGPKFRNDDISWDSSLENLQRFCAVFHKYGQTQIHGVTLRGCTNVIYNHNGAVAEYPGFDTIAKLDNATIRRLSESKGIENRPGLVKYLNSIPDEVALHGLYHTDYSRMSEDEQERDIAEGLLIMRQLFPLKPVRYFIAPFNRTNDATYRVAKRHNLTVLASEGVHLEEKLDRLRLRPNHWYRYHHHRFYPETQYTYSDLSIEKLDAALARNLQRRPAGLAWLETAALSPIISLGLLMIRNWRHRSPWVVSFWRNFRNR